MALTISTYTDPGVAVGEVISPNGLNVLTTPVQIGIVGVGDRTKRITNEAVQRGLVAGESLTVQNISGSIASISAPSGGVQTLTDSSATFLTSIIGQEVTVSGATSAVNDGVFTVTGRPSATTIEYINTAGVLQAGAAGSYTIKPYAALANRSDRRLQNTTIYRNNVALGDNFLAYQSAYVQGSVTADRNFTSPNNAMVLEMDGLPPITIRITAANAGSTSITLVGDNQFDVDILAASGLITAVTMAEVAAGINEVLQDAGAVALGYGASYAGAASFKTGVGLRIDSPLFSPSSDVRISAPLTNDMNAVGASQLFTASVVDAGATIQISRLVFSSSASYTADYIDIDSNADDMANTGVQEILKVGSFAGIGNFEENVDYRKTSDTIDWGGSAALPDLPAQYPAAGITGTAIDYTLIAAGSADVLKLSIDGKTAIELDLNQAASSVLGFTVDVHTASNAALVANINALLANSSTYGPRYSAVASLETIGSTSFIKLTSPTEGDASSIAIYGVTNTASNVIFGLAGTTGTLASVVGSGSRPALASVYFASYSITRPASDYNVQKRFFTADSARSDLGAVTAQNPLMIAVEIAFANNAPSVVVVQIDDSSSVGSPTRAEISTAIDASMATDLITDVVVLSTDLATQTDLKDHIEFASAPTEKRYRRGWFGMARSTNIGDRDTADTFVYRARRTLQVAADSPGRGRMLLVAPPQLTGVSRDITLEDGTTQTVNLDSSYISVALAAKKASFTSPADSLTRKSITGFNISDILNPWLKAERGTLASQGVMVLTYDAGVFKVLDPVTTEAGGGGLAAFKYESTSSQKDNITRKVDLALDANIVGIVPVDLADFIIDIKIIIRNVLSGEIGDSAIGSFRNSDGTTRAIDLTKDIDVLQDPDDPTKFFFSYWYNLRYPALRLFGQFSVDNPFFGS